MNQPFPLASQQGSYAYEGTVAMEMIKMADSMHKETEIV